LSLGPIIHNNDVVTRLEALGVHAVKSLDEVRAGDTVLIRSHGVGKAVYEALAEKGCHAVDATCPMVKRVHTLAARAEAAGRQVLLFGQRAHPEVEAVKGWCPSAVVLENVEEAENFAKSVYFSPDLPLTLLSQTTAEKENFKKTQEILKKECTNLEIFDTICEATSRRQTETVALAKRAEAVVVVGARHSANSRNLAELARKECPRVFFVENADELPNDALAGVGLAALTAGASTPEWIIKEVKNKMSDEIKAVETAENAEVQVEETKVEEAPVQAEPAVEEAPVKEAPAEDAEASFEEMLEQSIKTIRTGEKVSGVIASINQTEVSVDLGTKQSGYIPISELSEGEGEGESFKIGDTIEAYVMRVNDVEGTVMLSKKRLDSAKAWDNIAAARNEKITVEGTVVEENKGGIVVMVKGIRVFVPASQSGLPKDTPMTELVHQKVKLRITEVNQPRRRVVGSIRAVQFEERRARAAKVWEEIEVGKHYNGVVKSLTSYGAFVDIGGVDGMVHVSELTWARIHQPSEVVKVGDELDVYVISFDPEKKKISLGHKDPNGNPWAVFTGKYAVGDTAEVKIVKLMTFGAFAEIVPGVDGLIHISQIANRRIGKPEDVLSEGQQVTVKIIAIDEDKKKVSLS
ncbi:MAG: bifunctional 4-hydroxy-3-methylbut-2-enyl diphosphate reductase/30S ribosomal protein S1, partial [bacterium]